MKHDNPVTQKLLKLVRENPELPIIPMVYTEVVAGDEFGYWMGGITDCDVREYAIDNWCSEGLVRYRDERESEELLIESVAEIKYDGTDADYDKAREEVKAMWRKAIVLRVGLPTDEGVV